MSAFQKFPQCTRPLRFYVTGEACDAGLAGRIAALPPGVGVVYRNYQGKNRKALARAVLDRASGRPVLIAGHPGWVCRLGAGGLHLPSRALRRARRTDLRPFALVSAAVHNRHEYLKARHLGVDMVFLSPVFATKSHPGVRTLGPHRLLRFLARPGPPVLALGGMDERAMRKLPRHPGLLGYGAKSLFEEESPAPGDLEIQIGAEIEKL